MSVHDVQSQTNPHKHSVSAVACAIIIVHTSLFLSWLEGRLLVSFLITCMRQEMDDLLGSFRRWATALQAGLRARGWWCDAVDPCTGRPLTGLPGREMWSEVAALHQFLGYDVDASGVCPVALHPVHGVASPCFLATCAGTCAMWRLPADTSLLSGGTGSALSFGCATGQPVRGFESLRQAAFCTREP